MKAKSQIPLSKPAGMQEKHWFLEPLFGTETSIEAFFFPEFALAHNGAIAA
jgi:hypothetical protein